MVSGLGVHCALASVMISAVFKGDSAEYTPLLFFRVGLHNAYPSDKKTINRIRRHRHISQSCQENTKTVIKSCQMRAFASTDLVSGKKQVNNFKK